MNFGSGGCNRVYDPSDTFPPKRISDLKVTFVQRFEHKQWHKQMLCVICSR